MPMFRVANYYTTSVIHEVEAYDADEALEKGQDMDDPLDELADSLQYDESVIVE